MIKLELGTRVHPSRSHSYILAEFVALATARRIPRLAALTFIADLVENPDIEMVWVDEALHREAAGAFVGAAR